MRALSLLVNVLLVVFVFFIGTIELDSPPVELPGNDKTGHALAFFVIGIAQYWALLSFQWPKFARSAAAQRFIGAALGATLLGAALEVVQMFLPHRTAELGDLLADGLGAGLGAGVSFLLFR